MVKQTSKIGGGDKDKDSHKIWRDEVEEDLSIMGIKKQVYNGQRLSVRNGGRLFWEPRPTPSNSA